MQSPSRKDRPRPSRQPGGFSRASSKGSIKSGAGWSTARGRASLFTAIKTVKSASTNQPSLRGQQAGATGRKDNGWQLSHIGIEDRMLLLFNCKAMSDLTFVAEGREIPAHSLVLCSASPLFYYTFFEASEPDQTANAPPKWARLWEPKLAAPEDCKATALPHEVLGSGVVKPNHHNPPRIQVDYKYESFFEFLRYLYCDKVSFSIDNATQILNMADDFKVPELFERCVEYLRAEVRPDTALRLTTVFRSFLFKAVVSVWRELIDRDKAKKHFMNLNLADRRERMEAMKAKSIYGSSRLNSRASSICSTARSQTSVMSTTSQDDRRSVTSGPLVRSRRGSVMVSLEFEASKKTDYRGSDDDWLSEIAAFGNQDTLGKLTDVGRKMKFLDAFKIFYYQLAYFAQEYSERCWRVIQQHTEDVLRAPYWRNVPLAIVKEVMSIQNCNSPEIVLFRALNEWAEHRCNILGLPFLPETRREVVGEATLQLVRFPLLTTEELIWEVTPTGFLNHEELTELHEMKMSGNNTTRFNDKARVVVSDVLSLLKREWKDDLKANDMSIEDLAKVTQSGDHSAPSAAIRSRKPENLKSARLSRVVYKHVATDTIDALLGSKLYRDCVHEKVQTQDDSRRAKEAHIAIDQSSRPIFCGKPQTLTFESGNGSEMRKLERIVNGSEKASMVFLQKQLEPKVKFPLQESAIDMTTVEQARSIDFQRLSEGRYEFRSSHLIDIRLDCGEAFVFEANPEGISSTLPSSKDKRLNVGKFQGVPLDGFFHKPMSLFKQRS